MPKCGYREQQHQPIASSGGGRHPRFGVNTRLGIRCWFRGDASVASSGASGAGAAFSATGATISMADQFVPAGPIANTVAPHR